jgi:hypothetical protein
VSRRPDALARLSLSDRRRLAGREPADFSGYHAFGERLAKLLRNCRCRKSVLVEQLQALHAFFRPSCHDAPHTCVVVRWLGRQHRPPVGRRGVALAAMLDPRWEHVEAKPSICSLASPRLAVINVLRGN